MLIICRLTDTESITCNLNTKVNLARSKLDTLPNFYYF